MVVLPYNRYNAIISNSLRELFPIPSGLEFRLSEYVKSQLHFPFVVYKEGRSLEDYLNVIDIMENPDLIDDAKGDSLNRVLCNFYDDIGNAINNVCGLPSDFQFSLNCNLSEKLICSKTFELDNYLDKVKILLEESNVKTPVALTLK